MDAAAIAKVFKPDALQGRVALVTGGGSGICQVIAVMLAEYGAKIVVMGRREANLQETVDLIKRKGAQAIAVVGDVRSEKDAAAAVQKTVDTFGKLDVLINGAAGNFLALAEKLSTNAFRTVMEIDTVGTFNMCRYAFEELKKSEDACIINISATLHMPAKWYQVHASSAKAAIDSITRTLALEWGSYGIRVNGVAPGPIADTPGIQKLAGDVDPKELDDFVTSHVPIGRPGRSSDVAAAVIFLVSPAATFITGDTIILDGANLLYKQPVMSRETLTNWSKSMEKKIRTTPKAKL